MKQQTFSDIEYANRRRKTKREAFLDSMEAIIPWKDWVDMIRPFYHAGKQGRRPIDIETFPPFITKWNLADFDRK